MKNDELDRVLSREAEIAPSSGFLNAVMDAVRAEASAPPPIPFPWKRVLPGIGLCAVAVTWLVTEGFRLGAAENSTPQLLSRVESALDPVLRAAETYGVNWILLAFVMTYGAFKLSMRLAGRP